MSKGSSYTDQSILSCMMYPFMLKIFVAPVVDFAYLKKLGKCKTYILISGFIVRNLSNT
mgnify:FL=1